LRVHKHESPPGVTGRGLLFVNLAVVLFGLAGVLGELTELPAPLVTLGRALFGALALLAFAWVRDDAPRVRGPVLLLLVGQGLLLAAHWTTFFQAIAVAGVAVGLLAYATFPLFTAPLEWLLIGARPSRLQLLGSVGIVVGVYVLVPSLSFESETVQGIGWGLISAVTFALLAVLNRRAERAASSPTLSLYQNGIAALVLLPALAWSPPETLRLLAEPPVLLGLLVLGVGCTALAHTLFIAGLRQMTAQLASLLAALEPVWGILLAILLLGEWPSVRSLAGGAIIVLSTALPATVAFRRQSLQRQSPGSANGGFSSG
jgi:drug/metabolite transporter (DMT)-like permease